MDYQDYMNDIADKAMAQLKTFPEELEVEYFTNEKNNETNSLWFEIDDLFGVILEEMEPDELKTILSGVLRKDRESLERLQEAFLYYAERQIDILLRKGHE